MQDEIGRDDTRNGAGSADERRFRLRIQQAVGERPCSGAEQVEDEETEMPQCVFDIVADLSIVRGFVTDCSLI